MRCAIFIFGVLLTAPLGLFWDSIVQQPRPTEGRPAVSASAHIVEEFEALFREYQLGLQHFRQESDAASRNGLEPSITTVNPTEEYFLRFLALAEKYPGHRFCHTILGYAVCHCHGPHVTAELHE